MIPLILIGAAYLIGKTIKEESYSDGGSVPLLAPNGKPSKLTPEQWHLVRTPEFKAWFGDWENNPENASKVVDEETKEPKVMWHGSDYMDEINVFKSNKGHDYNFFSESSSESHRYIIDFERKYPNEKYNSKLRSKYYNSKIKPFFINARKIFDFNKINEEEKLKTIYFIDKNVDILFDTIIEFINNNLESYENWLEENDEPENISKKDLIIKMLEYYSDDWWFLETPVFQEYIKENKYDSFVTKESGWYNIAVYDSKQIKLADGSNTTFDSSNPDIRYEEGGEVDYSNFRTSVIGLFNKGKILILQRGSTANWMPNKWSIVGGVVDEGENPKEAIIRECFEEVGLKPKNVFFDYNIMTDDSGEIYYYHGNLESNKVKLDYENSNYAFISKSEIDNYDFVPHVKDFIIKLFSKK